MNDTGLGPGVSTAWVIPPTVPAAVGDPVSVRVATAAIAPGSVGARTDSTAWAPRVPPARRAISVPPPVAMPATTLAKVLRKPTHLLPFILSRHHW